MTIDLKARLASAVTEDEEREALMIAAVFLFDPEHKIRSQQSRVFAVAERLLNGPREGWIGVPLLAMPDGYDWTLYSDGSGTIGRTAAPGALQNEDFVFEAETIACGLMLAVLAARTTSDADSPGAAGAD